MPFKNLDLFFQFSPLGGATQMFHFFKKPKVLSNIHFIQTYYPDT